MQTARYLLKLIRKKKLELVFDFPESRSDEKDTSNDKKKVGIRTDITFELDDEKNDSRSISDEKGTDVKEIGKGTP